MGSKWESGQKLRRKLADVAVMIVEEIVIRSAQFIAVCSSAKPCKIGENLPSVSNSIARSEEIFIYASPLVPPSTLQRRHMSRLHPYTPVERSAPPMSPVPEPRRRSVGDLPLPSWL